MSDTFTILLLNYDNNILKVSDEKSDVYTHFYDCTRKIYRSWYWCFFYVWDHKNGYKHRIFDPKLSQYCFLTIIKILWKYQMKNPMFTPTFMTAHVKSWNWPKFQTSFFLQTNYLRLTKVLRITPQTLRYQKTGVFTAIFRFFYRPH